MPDHIRFLLRHAAWGGLAALVFAGLLLAFDVGHLRHLVTHTPEGPLAAAVMTVFFWITFGSVQIGLSIMAMGEEGGGGGGRRARAPRAPSMAAARLHTAPVRAAEDRARRGA